MSRVLESELSPDSDENDGVYYHRGEPFTGVAYSVHGNGRLRSETEFRAGLEWGLTRLWFPSGAPSQEFGMARGAFHGRKQEWYENGRQGLDEQWELGICLRRQRWDEGGVLVDEFTLAEGSPDMETLRLLRRWAERMAQAESTTAPSPPASPP